MTDKRHYVRDASFRRRVETRSGGSSLSVTNHYTNGGDIPSWTEATSAGSTELTRFGQVVSGDFGLAITTSSDVTTASLLIARPGADVVGAVPLADDATSPSAGLALGISHWQDFVEYGETDSSARFGWLGDLGRQTTNLGYVLLGARVYNPNTGVFTSIDTVYGGNSTAFAYPSDPVNQVDASGKFFVYFKWIRSRTYGVWAWGPIAYFNNWEISALRYSWIFVQSVVSAIDVLIVSVKFNTSTRSSLSWQLSAAAWNAHRNRARGMYFHVAFAKYGNGFVVVVASNWYR